MRLARRFLLALFIAQFAIPVCLAQASGKAPQTSPPTKSAPGALSDRIVAYKIDAKYEKGVLTVTCPKKEEAKPKAIEIKAAKS